MYTTNLDENRMLHSIMIASVLTDVYHGLKIVNNISATQCSHAILTLSKNYTSTCHESSLHTCICHVYWYNSVYHVLACTYFIIPVKHNIAQYIQNGQIVE